MKDWKDLLEEEIMGSKEDIMGLIKREMRHEINSYLKHYNRRLMELEEKFEKYAKEQRKVE